MIEFFDSLAQTEITETLNLLGLLIGGIIMAVGVIVARTVRVFFKKYYAPKLSKDSAILELSLLLF
ncbi:MscS mechanosensitive ion channel protein [Marine Group I thaumarchaeote SCGC AAA799-P11]|uniref:MscS mechanosensitive ion channel protein n=1 Tax=Marine Group I thaumarchaeote SCGC AAA799-P11 TaxID=1502295 RepID=A0A087RZG4_9ARCH|nr:MscS mechanosensitive ion channel protein [Marine Group I thaumarchaeote SCGC AAA799-P11]